MRRPVLQVGRKAPGYETGSTESPAMIDLTRCVVGATSETAARSRACTRQGRWWIGSSSR